MAVALLALIEWGHGQISLDDLPGEVMARFDLLHGESLRVEV